MTIHNLHFLLELMREIRDSIKKNKFESFKKTFMNKFEHIEKIVEEKYKQKDRKKKPKMKVSGKSVFTLQRLIARPIKFKKK